MANGSNSKAIAIGIFVATGGFLFGYEVAVMSGVLVVKDFKNEMNIKDNDGNKPDVITGAIVSILLIACFCGALLGGQLSDRFSRKYSISFFSFVLTIGVIIQMTSGVTKHGDYDALIQLLVGRFITGISVGALSMIVPVYHSEIAATAIRGRIITLQQWAITIGIATSVWINAATNSGDLRDTQWAWRIPLGIQIIPAMTLAIGILFCPFSPRWLISQDREDEAKDVLTKIRSGFNNEIEDEIERIKKEVAYLREHEIQFYYQLFRFPLLRPLLLGMGIQILQQLTGMNAVIYYAPKIFSGVSFTDDSLKSALIATGVNGCVNFLATIPTMIFIDRLGRRFLLLTGGIIMSFSMMIVAILAEHQKEHFTSSIAWALIVMVYIFVAAFAFSWGPIPWVYCAEIFPLTMRAKATSLTTAANWITNCAMSLLALGLLQNGISAACIVFSIFCALMIGIVYLFYPETRDRHLEENDWGVNNRIFVPQWLEKINRRINYNTLTE